MHFFGIRISKYQVAIAGIWLIVQLFLLLRFGIKTDGEALRIIREAESLSTSGSFSTPLYYTYLTEIMLVFLKMKTGGSYTIIVSVHLLLNLIALFCFFRMLQLKFLSDNVAFIGCVLLLLCIPFQIYNTFIYTESVFFSLCIIYSSELITARKFTYRKISALTLLLILLCFTRPTGLFVAGATLVYSYLRIARLLPLLPRILIFIPAVFTGLFMLNYLMGSGEGISVLRPFVEGHVICEVPTGALSQKSTEGNSIAGLLSYLVQHPARSMELALHRSRAFFGLTRPYYSIAHNIYLCFYFYSLYLLSAVAVYRLRKAMPLTLIYIFSLIMIYWVAVILSCDEWHNRFFITLTPFLIISALAGIYSKQFQSEQENR